jgi:signal transduction histidine kinase
MSQFTQHNMQRWTSLPVRQRGTLIIAIPMVCLFTSLASFAWLKSSLVEDEAWVQHTQSVRLETNRLLTALVDAETGVRGYGLTRRVAFVEPYTDAREVIPETLAELQQLVQDNPEQTQRLLGIQELVEQTLSLLDQKLTLQQELQEISGREELVVPTALLYDWLEEGRATMDTTREAIARFAAEEERLLHERKQHLELYRQISWTVLCLSAMVGTIGGLLAIHLFRQLDRELAAREANLRETNYQLVQACDQLQRFTANASHELRAPLSAILSNAQVGLMAPAENAVPPRQRLEKIVDLAKSMSHLVSDLLFLARHDGVSLQESFQSTDLVNLLDTIAAEWQPQAASQSLTLLWDLPNHPVWVMADPNLLRQAVINLLSNACRYTPANGKVQLRLLVKGDRTLIQVEDTGIGIPAEALPHIFERFYRVDKTRSRGTGGFGLGLAIAQQIIHAHNGQITVTSAVGQGTLFEVEMPLGRDKG